MPLILSHHLMLYFRSSVYYINGRILDN